MKNQKLLRCMMMATLIVIAGIVASGQVIIQNKPIGSDAQDGKVFCQPNIDLTKCNIYEGQHSMLFTPKPNKCAKEGQQKVNVTFQMEYDEESCSLPVWVLAYPLDQSWTSSGSFATFRNWVDNTFKEEFSVGIYDIAVPFPDLNGSPTFYVILENVEINSDTTIVIDQRTSTNHIQIISNMPNGEIYNPEVQTYGSHHIDNVNLESCFVRVSDACKILDTFFYNTPDLYINNISDRFIYTELRHFRDEESNILYIIDHTSTDLIFPQENDPAKWEYIEETFQPSVDDDGEDKILGVKFTACYNGLSLFSGSTWFESGTVTSETAKIYKNTPKRDDNFTWLIAPYYGHNVIVTTQWGPEPMDFNIYGLPTYVENGVKSYINNGLISSGINPLGFINEDGHVALHAYPGNPAFAFTEAQKTSNYGSGTPICLFASTKIFNFPAWQFEFIGRYGEVREVDRLAVELCLYVNGIEICNDINQLNNCQVDPNRPIGEVDINMSNKNVLVDGLLGKNITQIHIDEEQEDKDAPTLSMLWFKDNENRITDRFSTSDNAILEFSAGDFKLMYDENVSDFNWFTCQQPEVEVSYAPYGEDNWNELEVEEIPENFYMPCFGNFFRGSLAGVTGEALQGWFDLKIKLTDAAGNWQEQVISPAFRIDNLAYSSVATVGSGNAHEVARYNLAGQRVDASTPGVAIVKMSDGTARKVIVP